MERAGKWLEKQGYVDSPTMRAKRVIEGAGKTNRLVDIFFNARSK
jgi:hypothetical protein